MQEWLTFIGTEPQGMIGSFFIPDNFTPSGLEFAKRFKKPCLKKDYWNNEFGELRDLRDPQSF